MIIAFIIVIILVIMAIFLLNGKGAFLIAGYNTASKEEKSKYDEKALCRFIGWLMLVIAFCMLLLPAGHYFEIAWLAYCGVVIIILSSIGAVVYINTGNRFHKNAASEVHVIDKNPKSTSKAIIIATTVIPVIVLIAVGILIYHGDKDSEVTLLDNSVQISGMYGVTIDFTDITNISLIEKSMSEIGVGKRTSGYGGIGEALKGNFRSDELGNTLLFVQSKSSPTIRIERADKKDIYISFRTSEATETLYNEMMSTIS